MELTDIRGRIDEIDGELVKLLEKRMALSAEVARYKHAQGLPVTDPARERDVLDRACARLSDDGLWPAVRRLFEHVMAESRQIQQDMLRAERAPGALAGHGQTVAFLGPEGSFSHEALLQAFGRDAEPMPQGSFEDIVDRVAAGECAFGMLPLENTVTGGIFAAADLLTAGRVRIAGETIVAVRHCLLGLPGTTADGVAEALSHPQPLEQCRQFLRRRGFKTQACASTADACRHVAERGDKSLAAIASVAAGRMYGLVPLVSDIQDNPANYTRFAILSAESKPRDDANKISAVVVVEHRPGTLYGALKAFAGQGINLLNLVSRPVPGSPWQYCFHVDFDGNLQNQNVRDALREAGKNCRDILILGNYRKWEG